MRMPRGLRKLTEAANTLQAWKDWRKLANRARLLGVDDKTIASLAPKEADGWRKVDKCIKALRAKLEEVNAAR